MIAIRFSMRVRSALISSFALKKTENIVRRCQDEPTDHVQYNCMHPKFKKYIFAIFFNMNYMHAAIIGSFIYWISYCTI